MGRRGRRWSAARVLRGLDLSQYCLRTDAEQGLVGYRSTSAGRVVQAGFCCTLVALNNAVYPMCFGLKALNAERTSAPGRRCAQAARRRRASHAPPPWDFKYR